MDLSKALDPLNQYILVAKVYACGFTNELLNLIKSYLENSGHRTKVNTSFCSSTKILTGVSQGCVVSILTHLISTLMIFFILPK